MERVKDADDKRRCRASGSDGGQCWNVSAEGFEYCLRHGGRKKTLQETQNYLTEQFERRLILEGKDGDEIALLRENLMHLNMMWAARTQLITDEATLLVHSAPIAELLMKSEKVTVSLNRLAMSSGLLLAKPALITWGQHIVQAISEMVEDKYDGWEDDLIKLSDVIAGIICQTQNAEDLK